MDWYEKYALSETSFVKEAGFEDWFKGLFAPTSSKEGIMSNIAMYAIVMLLSGSPVASVSAWADDVAAKNKIDPQVIKSTVEKVPVVNLQSFKSMTNEQKKAYVKSIRNKIKTISQNKLEEQNKQKTIQDPINKKVDERTLEIAKAVWGETGKYWNKPDAISAVVWVMKNRKGNKAFSRNGNYSEVLIPKQFHGVGNAQYKFLESLLPNDFKGKSYEKKAWEIVLKIVREVLSGSRADWTDGALYFDHLTNKPNEVKFLTEFGRKYFGTKNPPNKWMALPDGKYLYLWKD